MKIIFSSNISWSIYNFRLALLKSLQNDGHIIYTIASRDKYSKLLENYGLIYKEVIINNNSTNPVKDFKIIRDYYKLYKEIDPDIICHNAIKPNIYGTIAAGFLGIPVVNNISGLGTLFIKKSISTKIAKSLYKISQRKASKVFFQNSEDLNLFIKNKLIDAEKCEIIPGSGVDTDRFRPSEMNIKNDAFHFLFVGRLLYDKGILEYVNAIKLLKKAYPKVIFEILGPLYESNSTSVNQKTLDAWVAEGNLNYLGETDNVQSFMEKADCIILPSYREGLSKVLIEASSMGLPIITTNVPGCRDVIIDKETGFLCNPKDSKDLALKMKKMILLSRTERENMGRKARKRAIEYFDQKIIINQYKNAINKVVKNS